MGTDDVKSRDARRNVILTTRTLSRTFRTVLAAGALAACSDEPPGPGDPTPVITVSGVSDGATVTSPVTITITVDVGTYQATLNGDAFVSGRTVATPDAYTLAVTARNGDATSSVEVAFTIALAGQTRLIIRMFDLGPNEDGGGGDAILLTDSSNAGLKHVLVDAGPAGPGGNDPAYVSRRLADLGVDTLDALILSHAHGDHFGGMSAVFNVAVVLRFVYNGQVRNFAPYTGFISLASNQADTVIVPSAERPFTVGFGATAATLTVLPPLGSYLGNANAPSNEINEGSLGAELIKGSFQMFFTGDGEVEANQRWRTAFAPRTETLDVLKAGHHGANDAIFDNGFNGLSTWLEHTAPEVVIVTANGTTHPRQNATAALVGRPMTRTYCTNVHGDIEIRVNEAGDYQVTVSRNQGSDCIPGTHAGT